MLDDARFDLEREVRRATNVARELSSILRLDAKLYKKIKPRTLRWLKKQAKSDKEKEEIRDKRLRDAKRIRLALIKLSDKEKELLGLPIDTKTDDE